MKKRILFLITTSILFSCNNKNLDKINFNKISEPCELVNVGIIICSSAKDLREKNKYNEYYDRHEFYEYHKEQIDKIENAWFKGFVGCMKRNRWTERDISYCKDYNELMRILRSKTGSPDF